MGEAEWALVHFEEVPLFKRDLGGVPEDSLALFSISSYAVSELNVIARALVACIHEQERDDVINAASFIQQACMARYWILKLFEFHDCLLKLKTGKSSSSGEVRKIATNCIETFETLESRDFYGLVRAVRNEAAGHYSFSAAKKNLAHVEDRAMAHMVAGASMGNSFYPLGEEVMFIGRLNQYGAGLGSKVDKADLVNKLFEWGREATKWVQECHTEIFRQLVQPFLDGKYKKKTTYWVSPSKVGDLRMFNVPVFARTELKAKA